MGIKMKMGRTIAAAMFAGSLLLAVTGCSAPRVTETGRSAVEQFLLSTVVENGIAHADFSQFKDKKIFIEYEYLAPQVDKSYVQGIFEMHLAKNGLIVTRDAKDAELLVQILCGVLATDSNTIMIGSPALPIPIPDTSISVAIPEIPLFKRLTRSGYGRFAFNILEAGTRKPVKTITGIETRSSYTNWTILLIPIRSHDMPLDIREGTKTSVKLDWD